MWLDKYGYDNPKWLTEEKPEPKPSPTKTVKVQINFKVTYEPWNDGKMPTKRELEKATRKFIKSLVPMTKSTLGKDSGELKIELY